MNDHPDSIGGELLSDLPIRRFMDFPKLQHLLSGRLYLTPASRFEDVREGTYTDVDHQRWDRQLADWGMDIAARSIAAEAKIAVARSNQAAIVISCWTTEIECAQRMWADYGRSVDSVVVETTVGRMQQILGPEYEVVRVSYLDYDQSSISSDNFLQPFRHKGRCYAWEKEVRVIGRMDAGKKLGSAKEVPIDVANFITKIGVHPIASDAFYDAVRSEVLRCIPSASALLSRIQAVR